MLRLFGEGLWQLHQILEVITQLGKWHGFGLFPQGIFLLLAATASSSFLLFTTLLPSGCDDATFRPQQQQK
jgi:hypothetical protein